MEAEEKSLSEIFAGGPQKLIVPFFQRRYVWEQENWDELLKAIEDNDDIQVFLGSIIIKWGIIREPSEATIVDGQQRLTTISLLTKAIYDEFSEDTRNNVRVTIQSVLFYKKIATDPIAKSEIKIEHSRIDRQEYSSIIKAGILDNNSIDFEEMKEKYTGQIGNCYLYYRKILHNKSQEEISKIFNVMYNDRNKMLVRIVLQEKDVNEQTIFDTINRAGTRLSTADIIKNNIFKGFLDSCEGNQQKIDSVNRMYDEKWDRIFYYVEKDNEWDKKRQFGNVSRSNLEFLLYCVACVKWATVDTSDFFSKLESVFAKSTANYKFADYEKLISDIYDYAKIYSKYITSLSTIMNDKSKREREYFFYKDGVRRLLLTLEIFKVQMFYPFVLKIIKEFKEDLNNPSIVEQCAKLESFVIRRRIIGSSVSDYASKCNLILNKGVDQLFVRIEGKEISISDTEIKSALIKMNDEAARMILYWVELSRRNKNSDIEGLTYTYTLEHIMPQKWKENWSVPEAQVDIRQAHINNLGNLTLLKNSLNIIVKNSDFKTKVEGIPATGSRKAREGYLGNISLYITEEIVNQYRAGNTVWDESTIEARKNKFAEEIIKLWPLY